ncbi:MAG TPA: hypothetical protein P5239_11720, partial [Victivallales bacterium]|nr:hypothetical protein [Victivallales bacterium]
YVFRVQPDIKHKSYKEYYKSGKIKIECTYDNGKINGPYVYWYENGQKALEGVLKNGLREGQFTEFYPDGRKKFVYTFKDDKLDGLWQEFYDLENSPIAIEKNYKSGVLLSELHKKTDGSVKFQKNYEAEITETK